MFFTKFRTITIFEQISLKSNLPSNLKKICQFERKRIVRNFFATSTSLYLATGEISPRQAMGADEANPQGKTAAA
jgi:hypothetical protein